MKQIQYEGNHFRGVYHAQKRPDPVCNDPIFQRMESNSQWKTCKDLQGKRNVYGDRNVKKEHKVLN